MTRSSLLLWYMEGLLTVHVDAHESDGAFFVFEFTGPVLEPSLHVHYNEDEMF